MSYYDPPEPPDEPDDESILCMCQETKDKHTACDDDACDDLHCPNDDSRTFDEMTESDIRDERMLRRWEQDHEEGLV